MMNLSLFTRLSILLIMGIVAPSHAALAPPTASPALNYDSLYSLLLGEFALQRNQTDIALREYSQQATATQDEQIIERAMQIANFLQDSKSALTLAQQWTTRNPKQAKAFYQLAYHALKERDFQQAMTAIDKLLVLEPETELEALFLSSYPTQVEQRKQLVSALTQLEKNYPKNAHLLFAHGLLVGENGDYRQALQFIEKAQQLNPHSVPTVLLYARLLSLNKQTTQALKVLEKALIHNPNSPQINMHYVRALISNKNYETAEKKLAQLLRNNPQNSEMLLMHALLSYDNQHDQQAINSFNKLLALQSNTGEAYYYLAMIAKRQNKPAEAENFLAQINEGERFLSAQVELAQLRIKDQRPKQVQQQFSEARQENPDIANTLYALEVEILRDNGQLEEAYALLTDAIGKHPQDNLLLFSHALLAERRDNLAQFELDMLELLKRDPKNASYLNAYGYTLANRTLRLSEAEPLLREAIKLKPNDPAIMDSIGWLLYKQGHLFEALTYIKKAFAASADEEIGLHLAEILWICGYKAEAVKIWQQLLSQKPNSEAVLKHRAQWEK